MCSSVVQMSEIQKKQCKDCGELKDRIQFGKFGEGRNKRWIDNNGKQWMGYYCPDCNKKRALANMHRLRNKPDVV